MGNAESSHQSKRWQWAPNASGRLQPSTRTSGHSGPRRRSDNWLDLHETQMELRGEGAAGLVAQLPEIRQGIHFHRTKLRLDPVTLRG